MVLYVIFCIIAGYLIGSIPFGYVFSKTILNKDVRKVGSGATGATNVMRISKWVAVLTFLCDFAKVWLAVFITQRMIFFFPLTPLSFTLYLFGYYIMLTGIFCIIGHNFPVWLGFKGGKGFAATLALVSIFSPLVFIMLVLLWLVVFAVFGFSSLASLTVLVIMPFIFLFLGMPVYLVLCLAFVSMLGIYMHKANIARLLKKEEFRFYLFGKKEVVSSKKSKKK